MYLLSSSVNLLSTYFFPGAIETNDLLARLITSESVPTAIVVVSILPAVCEEMLFRGCLLSSFRAFPRRWLIVLTVAVAFGIGHFDIYRFLPTTILGVGLTYVALASGSLFLSMLLHFILNIFSVVSAYGSAGESASAITSYPLHSIVATAIVYCAFALALIVLGYHFLNAKKLARKTYLVVGTAAVILFLIGIGITAFGSELSLFAALGSLLCDAAIAIAVFFVGWLILTHQKPSGKLVALAVGSSVAFIAVGTSLAMIGAEPSLYKASVDLTALRPTVTESFTVEEEGDYLIAVSFTAMNGSVSVSFSTDDPSLVLPPADSEQGNQGSGGSSSLFPNRKTSALTVETDTDDENEGKTVYLVTFEGRSLSVQTRQVHLLPGTYTFQTTLTPDEGAKDRDTLGRVVAIVSRLQ